MFRKDYDMTETRMVVTQDSTKTFQNDSLYSFNSTMGDFYIIYLAMKEKSWQKNNILVFNPLIITHLFQRFSNKAMYVLIQLKKNGVPSSAFLI
jgi:hypothetical protein